MNPNAVDQYFQIGAIVTHLFGTNLLFYHLKSIPFQTIKNSKFAAPLGYIRCSSPDHK